MKKFNISFMQILLFCFTALIVANVYGVNDDLKNNPAVAVIDSRWLISMDRSILQDGDLVDKYISLGDGIYLVGVKDSILGITPVPRGRTHVRLPKKGYWKNAKGHKKSANKIKPATLIYRELPDSSERLVAGFTAKFDTLELDNTKIDALMIQDALGIELEDGRTPAYGSVIYTQPERKLILEGTEVTDKSIEEMLSKKANYTVVEIKNCANITNEGIAMIAEKCPKLNKISLAGCRNMGNSGIGFIGLRCPKLLELHVSDCQDIGSLAFNSIAKECPYLTKLSVEKSNITQENIISIAKKCKELANLSFTECRDVNDDFIMAIGDHGRKLIELSLTRCNEISDAALKSIALQFRKLTNISLNACEKLTDDGIVPLVHNHKKVVELLLTECNITDAISSELAQCKELAKLSLSKCGLLTDGILKSLPPSIIYLDLSGSNFTDEGIKLLAERCPELRILNLSHCPHITKDVIPTLIKLGNLRELHLGGLREASKEDLLPLLQLSRMEILVSFDGQELRGREAIEEYLKHSSATSK